MRHLIAGLGAAVLLVVSLLPTPVVAAVGGRATMRISSVTAKPHTVSRHGILTFFVTVQGIRLSYKHMGKKSAAGEGHLQFYLDRVPKDAWTRADLKQSFLAQAGTPTLSFSLKTSRVKISAGRHRILVALAKNNGILYRVPVASVTVTVK